VAYKTEGERRTPGKAFFLDNKRWGRKPVSPTFLEKRCFLV
jgi:hypothetical protein